MRILGIDPGLLRTGWGVVESRGGRVKHVASGVVRIPTDFDLPARLRMVFEGVQRVAEEHVPDVAAIEDVFVNMNPRTTLLLGQARGVAIAALATAGLPVAEYGAMQIKQAVTGHGRATKDQVQRLVTMLLSLPEAPRKDEADALACALCHAHGGATSSTLAAAHAAAGSRTATLAQGAVSRSGGRLSAGGPAELPPALAALGLRVRRGRLVRQ